MPDYLDLVRFRNDGDEFHILWTARRTLKLLDPSSGLVAVAVEGVSDREAAAGGCLEAGLLVVDTAEYYGSEAFDEAERITYCQLKYSTKAPDKPWTLSGLADTIQGFARRFEQLHACYGLPVVQAKVRFRFVTNRPVAAAVEAARAAAEAGTPTLELSADVRRALDGLVREAGLASTELAAFAGLLELRPGEGALPKQELGLRFEAARFTPVPDLRSTIALKDLVRGKTVSAARDDPVIRPVSVLHALGVLRAEDLLPAPPALADSCASFARAQEDDITSAILAGPGRVVVHAPGGVGKSVLAQRLAALMPAGSEAVVFDGFANGAYRNPAQPRHRHGRGLVQIANELATRGLCDPLLPHPQADEGYYLEAFWTRLDQATRVVRARSKDAVLLVVLDAADNSETAAREDQGRSFARDLMQDAPPPGCHVVAIARSHRVGLLSLPPEVVAIELEPFRPAETALHLRSAFPGASRHDADEFHRLTGGNPRVQANELAAAVDLPGMLAGLGPGVRSVEDAITGQLNAAMAALVHAEGPAGVGDLDALCTALAALPPFVPVHTLALAAGTSPAAVRSFIVDLGGSRPLLLRDDAVQFRDEPVETWFRDRFVGTPDRHARIADLLAPLAETDAYVASALPQLLWTAGRHDELIRSALAGPEPTGDDPVERRDILLRRVRFALRASLDRGSSVDTAKLLIRAADEAATNGRQASFLAENADLVATLAGPEAVRDFVFRQAGGPGDGWTVLGHCAAMLSGEERYRSEARSYLRAAIDWLREWAGLPDEKRKEQPIGAGDIAAMALASVRLDGVRKGVRCIADWRPATVPFRVGRIVARRLFDAGRADEAARLAAAAAALSRAGPALAAAAEFSEAAVALPAKVCARAVRAVLRAPPPGEDWDHQQARLELAEGVLALAEAAAHHGLPAADLLNLLTRHAPPMPSYVIRHGDHDGQRGLLLRHAALRAVLEDRPAALEEVAPERLREQLARSDADGGADGEVRAFRSVYLPLLAWHELRARVVTGRVAAPDVPAACWELIGRRTGHPHYSDGADRSDVATAAARLWLDCLLWSRSAGPGLAPEVEAWLDREDVFVDASSWTDLARRCAHHPAAHPAAIQLAARAARLIEAQHADAGHVAGSYATLARAVLPASPDEARAYFGTALERLDRIGDELDAKLSCLLAIAERATVAGIPLPQEAYRLARAAELFHEHNSHKFPWDDVAEVVAGLCPASALAIVSRWRDRNVCRLDESLPAVALRLLRDEVLDGGAVAALHAFGGYWPPIEDTGHPLAREPDLRRRELALSMLASDVEFDGGRGMTAEGLLAAAGRNGLDHPRLRDLAAFRREEERLPAATAPTVPNGAYDVGGRPEPDWPAILGPDDLTAPDGIDAVVCRMRNGGGFYRWEELFRNMRRAVPPAGWAAHVAALVRSSELNASLALDAIEAAAGEWRNSAAVGRAVARAALDLVRNNPFEFARSRWGLQRQLPKVVALSGRTLDQVFATLARSIADHVDLAGAESLLGLAETTVRLLGPDEALDTLGFALDRLEPLLGETDGDGPWRPELAPPQGLGRALAGLLYATLAAPEAALRWRAAHALRRLCRLGDAETVGAVCGLLNAERLPVFTDADLPFYALHARLYALVALARAAGEAPAVLRPHAGTFVRLALDDLPHVLVRRLAAEAALRIEEAHPGTVDAGTAERLRRVNDSSLPRAESAKDRVVGWDNLDSTKTRFAFGYDVDRYWFGPLAEAFNLRSSDIALRADVWIAGRWGAGSRGWWKEDPRAQRGHYRTLEAHASHGEYPSVDSHSFYLEYHAMLCVAGDLLAELPAVGTSEWGEDPWAEWLSRHDLTRRDGLWLADRRDPAPLEKRRWQREGGPAHDPDWRWSVLSEDFDEVLGVGGDAPTRIVVCGNWTVRAGDRREELSVSSALVTPRTVPALVRALQTVSNSHDFRLPDHGEDLEIRRPGFRLTGWVSHPHRTYGLDRFDPFAGNLPWPLPRPSRPFQRVLRLTAADDGRRWCALGATGADLSVQVWGDHAASDRGGGGDHGTRVEADLSRLLAALQALGRDLIIEVAIRRGDGRKVDEESYSLGTNFRIYHLSAAGELCTLRGRRRLGPEAGGGARA